MAILLAGAALVSKRRVTRETAVLALATAALATFSVLPFGIMWIWALLAVTAAVLVAEHFRAPWWTRGELTRGIAWWIASSIAVSGGALVVWWLAFRPALSELTFPGWVQRLPPVGVAAVFVAWASLNALAEESYFRGMMQHALTASLGRAGVVVQAIAFGVFHLQGFPNGATGVALATIFGLMVGALRERARGLLAPWIAHVAADIVIVTIIAMTRR
jgi:membrane protease YdiL (CAAX protease family)